MMNTENNDDMKAELILPIDSLRGKLDKGGYYFRMYKGKQIVQRCPDRSKHIKTEAEKANQERFAKQFAGKIKQKHKKTLLYD